VTRIAVTGAGGYVGSALVGAAAERDDVQIRSIVREPAEWLTGEIARIDDLETGARSAVEGVDAVVHLAGPNEVQAGADPVGSIASALSAARAVATACRDTGVRRLVYVSTVHVYGAAMVPGATIDENTVPMPRHPYAIARLAGEHLIAGSVGHTEVVVLRLTNSVGAPAAPGVDRWSLLANDLCRQAVSTGRLVLRSDGYDWRDFVPLSDVVDVVMAAADPERIPPGTYNLGSGTPMTVRQLAALVIENAERSGVGTLELTAPEGRAEPPAPYTVDVSKLATAGLSAATSMSDAIAATLAFCQAHRAELS
jgi:UDP-glucose 4-epimerase